MQYYSRIILAALLLALGTGATPTKKASLLGGRNSSAPQPPKTETKAGAPAKATAPKMNAKVSVQAKEEDAPKKTETMPVKKPKLSLFKLEVRNSSAPQPPKMEEKAAIPAKAAAPKTDAKAKVAVPAKTPLLLLQTGSDNVLRESTEYVSADDIQMIQEHVQRIFNYDPSKCLDKCNPGDESYSGCVQACERLATQ